MRAPCRVVVRARWTSFRATTPTRRPTHVLVARQDNLGVGQMPLGSAIALERIESHRPAEGQHLAMVLFLLSDDPLNEVIAVIIFGHFESGDERRTSRPGGS